MTHVDRPPFPSFQVPVFSCGERNARNIRSTRNERMSFDRHALASKCAVESGRTSPAFRKGFSLRYRGPRTAPASERMLALR